MALRRTGKHAMVRLIADRCALSCAALLALAVVAGCGREERARTPRPNVDPSWVTKVRREAATVVASGAGASAGDFDGWAHLKGRIVVTGTTPSLPPLSGAAQDKYCGTLPKQPNNEAI